jgi:hypothetical protein
LGPKELYSHILVQIAAATMEKFKINCKVLVFITVRKGLVSAN